MKFGAQISMSHPLTQFASHSRDSAGTLRQCSYVQGKSLRHTGRKTKANHLATDAKAKAVLISLDARTFEYGAAMPQKARYMGNWNHLEGEENVHASDRNEAS